MAHQQQFDFVSAVASFYPNNFVNCKVLEVGSLDINGSVRQFFKDCNYIGIDLGEGKGVDIVCTGQDYDAPNNEFDTIISCECFEHNPYYKETIQNSVRMLKSGGLFIFTCATTGRPVHGTISLEEESKKKYPNWKTMPNVEKNNWDNDYYKNLTESDIRECLDFEEVFNSFSFEIECSHCDLYFWGIKK